MVNTELVQDFVNSRELRPAVEDLETPKHLSAWLCERGLLEPGARVTKADLAEAMRVREALRDVLSAKVGIEVDLDGAMAEIDAAARRAGLELRFDPTCPRVEPTVGGVRGAIGRILVEVYDEMVDGSLGADEGVQGRRLPLGVPRHVQEQDTRVVLDGELRQPRQGARVPAASPATSHCFRLRVGTDTFAARTYRCLKRQRKERNVRRALSLLALVAALAFTGAAAAANGSPVACGGTLRSGWRLHRVQVDLGVALVERLAGLLDQTRLGRLVLQAQRRHHQHLDRGALLRHQRARLVLATAAWKTGGGVGATWATFEAHAQWTVTPLHIYNNTDIVGLTVPTIDG